MSKTIALGFGLCKRAFLAGAPALHAQAYCNADSTWLSGSKMNAQAVRQERLATFGHWHAYLLSMHGHSGIHECLRYALQVVTNTAWRCLLLNQLQTFILHKSANAAWNCDPEDGLNHVRNGSMTTCADLGVCGHLQHHLHAWEMMYPWQVACWHHIQADATSLQPQKDTHSILLASWLVSNYLPRHRHHAVWPRLHWLWDTLQWLVSDLMWARPPLLCCRWLERHIHHNTHVLQYPAKVHISQRGL